MQVHAGVRLWRQAQAAANAELAPRGPPAARVVARRRRSLVFLELREVWAFEATEGVTVVHATHGKFDLDLSLAAVESSFGTDLMRVHRNWLVNFVHVKELERENGETRLFVGAGVAEGGLGVHVPVARERSATVREALLANGAGLRLR